MEISKKDYDLLVEAIDYVIQRAGREIDETMVDFLKAETGGVQRRVQNENYGSSEAREIDAVLGFLGGPEDDQDDGP